MLVAVSNVPQCIPDVAGSHRGNLYLLMLEAKSQWMLSLLQASCLFVGQQIRFVIISPNH